MRLANLGQFLIWLLLAAVTFAGGAPVAGADDRFSGWVSEFRSVAVGAGVSPQIYDTAFRTFPGPDRRTIEKLRSQAEFDLKIWEYLDSAVSEAQIRNGGQMRLRYARQLDVVEKRFGVDRDVILAIWGIETRYGERMGDHNVIQTLATLAYAAPRRQAFWRSELINALKIVEAGHIQVTRMNGSWAGAMGHTQFMPSSWKGYAADFNSDGRKDIWTNVEDAFASTANYLARHGWEHGKTWGYEVVLPQNFDTKLAGKDGITLGRWHAMGVRRINGMAFPRPGDRAVLKLLAGQDGPAFLVLRNFYVIKRYNNADSYALAVGHLADRIAGSGPIVQAWPRGYMPLDEAERMELQVILKRLGYYSGDIDGAIGSGSRSAIKRWQAANGLDPDGYASKKLLEKLKALS
jgi:membrane-bound lytic murein transglycosylase B